MRLNFVRETKFRFVSNALKSFAEVGDLYIYFKKVLPGAPLVLGESLWDLKRLESDGCVYLILEELYITRKLIQTPTNRVYNMQIYLDYN